MQVVVLLHWSSFLFYPWGIQQGNETRVHRQQAWSQKGQHNGWKSHNRKMRYLKSHKNPNLKTWTRALLELLTVSHHFVISVAFYLKKASAYMCLLGIAAVVNCWPYTMGKFLLKMCLYLKNNSFNYKITLCTHTTSYYDWF